MPQYLGYPRPQLTSRRVASNIRNPRTSHSSNNASSPLISAIQNPSELISRAIPFPTFLASSSPSSGTPNSLGSASGGVGLSGGPSPPPSAPASYSSAGGFSTSRQVRGYPGFEEQYSAPYGSAGRYPLGSSLPPNGQINGGIHLPSGDSNFACELATIDELGFGGAGNTRNPSGTVHGGDNVVCLGWDGGVDIWRIGRNTVEQVGRMEGLKGCVKGAKILPNPPLNDPLAAHRPLICLTVHSPILQGPGSDSDDSPATLHESDSPYSSSPPTRPETSTSHRSSQNGDVATDWQTTVEVWSLSTRTRLCTLFTSPLIPTAEFGKIAPPPVWGNLRVQVTADRIAMGVGSSGEVYVFGVEANKTGKYPQAQWKCVEKVWTYVHHPVSNEGGYDAKPAMFGLHSVGTTVFALSDRWLAYCPAEGGALSAGGDVGVPIICPSLVLSQIPPPQPSISAAVSLEDEALFNRMAREVTQGLVRAAGWAADAGMKKFQSYWNGNGTQNGSPPQSHVVGGGMGINGFVPPNSGIQPGALPQPSGLGQQIRQYQMGGQLPQTYTFTPQHANDPRLVSIIDLQKPRQENTPPMATVLPPSGASFLSFAPGGLHLLSVSTKGDLIMVWDLMKVVHHPPGSISMSQQRSNSGQDPKAMAGPPETIGRYIRLIARHARLTVSTVVEVDWSSPRGEKFAVITERGTAHFYDLPYPALQWPPQPKPPPSYASSSPQTTAAGAAVSGAVNLFNSSTQPLLTAARRRRSRSSSVGSPTALFGSPTTGRRGPTAGTPPTDAGESKINLPTSSFGVSPGCVKFLTAKERGHVAVLGGGVLRIYELRPSGSSSKPAGVSSGNWWEYDLPTVPSASHTSLDDFSDGKAAGFWAIRSHWNRASDNSTSQDFWKTPLAWAEIETSGNRMPWHQDRRVKMFFYTPPPPSIPPRAPSPAPDHTSLLSPWPTNPELPEVRSKKKPRSKTRAAKVPDTPSPQLAPQAGGGWVFGLPMVAERVFLRDAGGRGDVEFAGGGVGGLADAMGEGLGVVVKANAGGSQWIFEDGAEVLDFA